MSKIVTMTKEEFSEAWREECRDFFQILVTIPRRIQGPAFTDGEAHDAVKRQRVLRGELLTDRLRAGELVVLGWEDEWRNSEELARRGQRGARISHQKRKKLAFHVAPPRPRGK